MNLTTTILEEAKEKFGKFRESVVDAMAVLYDVHVGGAWKEVADTWGQYVESELQISQGFASKLLTTYTHYCITNDFAPEKLIGVDYERLYLATKLTGSPDEQLAKAKTLTRLELRQEKNDEEPVPHLPEYFEICRVCNVSKPNHR
jgi:hypothetical protein